MTYSEQYFIKSFKGGDDDPVDTPSKIACIDCMNAGVGGGRRVNSHQRSKSDRI